MFNLFETFVAVYESKSFTQAARQLYISQPTATVRIKKLEEELRVTLFSRGQNQDVIPTEAANLLYHNALQYIEKWNKLKLALKQKASSTQPFKIAVSHSAATSVMPLIFNAITSNLDQIDLEVSTLNSEEVFRLVSTHDIHFGVIEKPMIDESTETFPLFRDELVLAGDLQKDTFFIRETGSGVNHYTQLYLKEQKEVPKHLITMNNNEMILAHINAGLGASLISKRFLTPDIPYQTLGKKYQRLFYGVTFASEHNKFVNTLISKIKSLSENF